MSEEKVEAEAALFEDGWEERMGDWEGGDVQSEVQSEEVEKEDGDCVADAEALLYREIARVAVSKTTQTQPGKAQVGSGALHRKFETGNKTAAAPAQHQWRRPGGGGGGRREVGMDQAAWQAYMQGLHDAKTLLDEGVFPEQEFLREKEALLKLREERVADQQRLQEPGGGRGREGGGGGGGGCGFIAKQRVNGGAGGGAPKGLGVDDGACGRYGASVHCLKAVFDKENVAPDTEASTRAVRDANLKLFHELFSAPRHDV